MSTSFSYFRYLLVDNFCIICFFATLSFLSRASAFCEVLMRSDFFKRTLVVLFLSTHFGTLVIARFESLIFNIKSFFDDASAAFKSLSPFLALRDSRLTGTFKGVYWQTCLVNKECCWALWEASFGCLVLWFVIMSDSEREYLMWRI